MSAFSSNQNEFAYWRVAFIVILLCVLLLTGCYREVVSQGDITSDKWHSQIVGSGSLLSNSNVKILVKTSNRASTLSRKTQYDYLGISLWYDVSEPGFKFNPNGISLFLPGVPESRPSSVDMKYAGDTSRYADWDCGNYPKTNSRLEPPYSLRRGSCFELYFYVKAPTPDTPFSMRIEGLSLDGKPVKVPEVHFHKGSFRVFDFLGK